MSEQRKIEYDAGWSCSGCQQMLVLPLRFLFRQSTGLWHCESTIEECANCRRPHLYVPLHGDDSGFQNGHEWRPTEVDEVMFTARMPKAVYSSLRHALGVKMMTGGAYGILDDFLRFVVSHVEKEKTDGVFVPKKTPPADSKL